MANIKKIKLSNGNVYSIFDEGALRLIDYKDPTTQVVRKVIGTGNSVVDQVIIEQQLTIAEIDDIDISKYDGKVIARDKDTGILHEVSLRKLLNDLGVITASVDEDGTLSLESVALS